jgi:perosamine synthetase
VVVALSVRSAFDALLTALALPVGAEVLLSGWTIPDMVRIVRAHGLVPVALDCAADTLAPTVFAAEHRVTPRARVLMLAQLFGARVSLAPWAAFARRHGLLLVNDDAQGFTGPARLASAPEADVSLYSFGAIKTATALGGALVRVRDPALRDRMRRTMAAWPVQPAARYARRVSTYLGLVAPRDPARYAQLAAALAARGRDLDALIMGATRGFPADTPEALLRAIRWRPSDALADTLARRLEGWHARRLDARTAAGESLRAALGPGVRVLGAAMPDRTHWLFAVSVAAPDALVSSLRAEGFDAARGTSSLAPVSPEAADCVAWSAGVVFLPAYPEVPAAERARLADLVRAHVSRHGGV